MRHSFRDDYSEGAHPEILRFIAEHNDGQEFGYGMDRWSALAADRVRETFGEAGSDVHFVHGGTAANVISLAAMLRPFDGVISARTGHINTHETGALEATGHKILYIDAPDGKLSPELIRAVASGYQDEHTVLPAAVYVSQATELGTVYSAAELKAIAVESHKDGLLTYLDGARLGVALTCTRGDMNPLDFGSLGLDIYSVGGTKNGALFGEAIVVCNDDLKPFFRHHIKQHSALMAKGRFMGLQFARFFDEDGLWFSLGKHANRMALLMWEGLLAAGAQFDPVPDGNQLFPVLPEPLIAHLEKDWDFYRWEKVDADHTKIRLVTSWATTDADIEGFLEDVTSFS